MQDVLFYNGQYFPQNYSKHVLCKSEKKGVWHWLTTLSEQDLFYFPSQYLNIYKSILKILIFSNFAALSNEVKGKLQVILNDFLIIQKE